MTKSVLTEISLLGETDNEMNKDAIEFWVSRALEGQIDLPDIFSKNIYPPKIHTHRNV